MRADELFSFPDTMPFGDVFAPELEPWEWVKRIKPALHAFAFGDAPPLGNLPAGVVVRGPVWLDPSVRLPPYCVIEGPAWIGPEVEIRPGAFVRGNVIVGRGSCLGNTSEYKNCLLLEEVETPHYNYVGDSVLGNRAHLGAGAICANLKLARDEVSVTLAEGGRRPTGLRKLGALLGDGAEATCNCVLQPGTILGRRAAVLAPSFHGFLPAGKIALARLETRILDRPD
jgi:UDP-N-acetylglucosamine diphosphorylase / glucose-1-phosphate thymidylyltransferase / UDP-N-acetylgalactosamine diphosphorylase / glucosamine-1-phosphate N-acetyltransferase / galactosamine-1-phosphate N-acetyltransferase